jgi:hypothetical protein
MKRKRDILALVGEMTESVEEDGFGDRVAVVSPVSASQSQSQSESKVSIKSERRSGNDSEESDEYEADSQEDQDQDQDDQEFKEEDALEDDEVEPYASRGTFDNLVRPPFFSLWYLVFFDVCLWVALG